MTKTYQVTWYSDAQEGATSAVMRVTIEHNPNAVTDEDHARIEREAVMDGVCEKLGSAVTHGVFRSEEIEGASGIRTAIDLLLEIVRDERQDTLKGCCVLDQNLEPILATLNDPDDVARIAELDEAIAAGEAALAVLS